MARIALFVLSLAMLSGGAFAAQSAIEIGWSVKAEPIEAVPKRDKIMQVVRWDGYGQSRERPRHLNAIAH